jgi:hypothetical protein
MPNIELLVEAIRARIRARVYTLQSDPDPEPDDATLRDLERAAVDQQPLQQCLSR